MIRGWRTNDKGGGFCSKCNGKPSKDLCKGVLWFSLKEHNEENGLRYTERGDGNLLGSYCHRIQVRKKLW